MNLLDIIGPVMVGPSVSLVLDQVQPMVIFAVGMSNT